MAQNEQMRPFAIPSPEPPSVSATPVHEDLEGNQNPKWRPSAGHYLRKRQCLLCCCGCAGVTVVLLGLVVLVLALVFKIKDPSLTMNNLHVAGLRTSGNPPVAANLTLTADISMKNPNDASFVYGNSTTEFYYGGVVVGVAHAEAGKVGPDRTVRFNETVEVVTTGVVAVTNLTETMGLRSYTEIAGRVNVMGIYKKHKTIMLNCTMTLDMSLEEQDIQNISCTSRTS